MAPRVGHIVASSGFYGAERVIVLLAKAQAEGCLAHPVVISLEDSPETRQEVGRRAERDGIDVCYVPVSNLRFHRSVCMLADSLRRHRIDLAHAHGYKGLILGARACCRVGIPIVATNHGWDAPTWRVRLYQRWEARIMRSLPAVVAVSRAKAEQLRRRGVPEALIRVIPNSVSMPPVGGALPAPRIALGVSAETPLVGYLGRLAPIKGVDVLMQAFARVRRECDTARLVVAGDGPARGELGELAASLGIADAVDWMGFVDDTETVYAACDVVALPSRDEGLPMTLLEAMGYARAVVAADVGGVGEVVQDGVNGRLVPSEDPDRLAAVLVELLLDGPQRARLGRAARLTVESRYSSRAMAAGYDEVYRRVLGKQEHT